MAARASVAIRLGTEGKATVKADLREIANDGDATATRWARSFERAGQDVEAAMQRQRLAAEKLAQITPATPMQRQVQASASTSYTGGTAQESAQFFAQQAAAMAQVEARANALRASIDPVWAAQQRFNAEMAEARALISAGAISLDEYVAKLGQERAALEASSAAGRRNTASIGQMRAGSQQLSFQIGDVAQQFALGTPPMVIFAQQGGQVVQAVQMMTGSTGGLIGFLAGPWGAVISGGAMLLGMFAGKLLDGSEAAKEKERAAKDLQAAIDALEQRTRSAIETEREAQVATLASATTMRQKALDTRAAAVEQLNLTMAELQRQRAVSGSMMSTNGMNANPAQAAAASNLARLRAEADTALKQLNQTTVAFRNAQAAFVGSEIQANLDRSTRLTRDYEKSLGRINSEFRRTGDVAAMTRARGDLEKQYKADQEALQKSEQKRRGLTDAERAARRETREAAKEARDYARDLQSLIDKFDPAAAAARRYAEAIADIDRASAPGAKGQRKISTEQEALLREGAFEDYAKARAGLLGDTLGMEGIRADGESEDDRSRRFDQRRRDLADQIEFAQKELSLVAANDNLRERELATLRMIQELKREFPDLTEEETVAEAAKLAKLIDINEATAKARADWEQWRDFASNTLDEIFDPNNWENWGDLGKRILMDLAKEFIALNALNPIKNQMFGTDLPTSSGFFSFLGFASGTYHAPGGVALVGENGPELVSLPRGSQVKGTSATRQALGGMGGMSVHIDASIHAPGADAAALARVEENQRQMMAQFPRIAVEAVADAQQRLRGPVGLNR